MPKIVICHEPLLALQIEHIEAAAAKLKRLDVEAGPRALTILAPWTTQRREVHPEDLQIAEKHVARMWQLILFARDQIRFSRADGAEDMARGLDGLDELLTGWLRSIHDGPTMTMRRAGWLGVRALTEGDRRVAELRQRLREELQAMRTGERPAPAAVPPLTRKRRGRGGRPAQVHMVVKRIGELLKPGQVTPDAAIRDIIAGEAGYEYELRTLQRYWRDRERHLKRRARLAA